MKKVLFLESVEGIETLFTRGLRTGASQAGWKTSLTFLRNKAEEQYPISKILNAIRQEQPDLICFIMDAPLPWEDLWEKDGIRELPKMSFWFDDFLRSPHTLEFPQRWETWQKEYHVKVFIWDGYWRREWRKFTNCEAYPIHLAADESLFNSQAQSLFPELKDFAVMIGTIPSLTSLQKEMSALPSPIQKILQECANSLEKEPWPILPYPCAEKIINQSPEKIRVVVQDWLKQPINRALFHHQLWRWGKRIARLRGLQAVAKSCPVAVLSGHHTEFFAEKEEIQKTLPQNSKFEFRNTTNIPANQWSGLFHSGKFQFQITDPQSIEGGIPFRVFECAACEAPLLSDYRKELEEIFPDLPMAKTENDISEKSSEMLSQDLKSIAQKMRAYFLAHHTWKLRWQQMTQHLDAKSPTPIL